MRVANILRAVLLGGLIVTGVFMYRERGVSGERDPAPVVSLIPSPVTVTGLTGHSS